MREVAAAREASRGREEAQRMRALLQRSESEAQGLQAALQVLAACCCLCQQFSQRRVVSLEESR